MVHKWAICIGHLGFFPKGLTYDFGQKIQMSSKFMYGQHEARNDVWWCSECWEGHFDHIWRFSNLAGGHLEFFPKGLTYDFGQKFQISSKFMYGQHEAGNNVWWCFRVLGRSFWPYMEIFCLWVLLTLWSKFQSMELVSWSPPQVAAGKWGYYSETW